MLKLKDYSVEFFRNSIFRWWSYTITTPDKRTLVSLFGGFTERDVAEKRALQQIELDMARASLSGEDLKKKVEAKNLKREEKHGK